MSSVSITPRRWLLLPVGIQVREFDTNTLLAFAAVERGWGVVFGGEGIRHHRRDFPRGVLMDKNMGPDRFLSIRGDGDGTTAIIDRDETGVATGNPRFDLLRPDLRAVFSDRARRAGGDGRPMILVNTKFSKADGIYSPEARLRKMRARQRVRSAEDEVLVLENIENHRAGLVAFTEMVRSLSARFPDVRIVVRPHPYERVETWRYSTRGLGNVDVVRDGHVAAWILASEVCIHTNCTTGIEAYLLGKPVISYRPVVDDRFDQATPNALSTQAYSLEDVLTLVGTVLAGGIIATDEERAERHRVAEAAMLVPVGKTATERVLDALDELPLPQEPLTLEDGARQWARLAMGQAKQLLRRLRAHGDQRIRAVHDREKSDGITAAALYERLDALRRVTGRSVDIVIAPIERNLAQYFCVYTEARPSERRQEDDLV